MSVLLALACLAAPASATLSLEEKVGQLFIVAIDTTVAARYEPYIRSGRLGGGLLRWDKFTGEQAREFSELMQGWAAAAPARVPFLLAADHEGGTYFTQRLYGATIFPGHMALGAAGSRELAEQAAFASGRELRSLGIRMNFAPVLDVNSNPDNPVIGVRSFGEDAEEVAALGAAAVRGYARAGIAATAKHYPGHGDTSVDSHLGLPVSSRTLAQLEREDLLPFAAAVRAGVPAIMPAHMVFPALGADGPVTLSSAPLAYLRRVLRFKGVIVSDSMDMAAITSLHGSTEAARRAFDAGCDVLLLGKADYAAVYQAFLDDARTGRLAPARLEEAVARILELKRRLGLYGRSAPDVPLAVRRSPKNLALARRIAERSVTVLRADPAILPLGARSGKVLVALPRWPPFSAEARQFFEEFAERSPGARFAELPLEPTAEQVEATVREAAGSDTVVLGLWFWSTRGPGQLELARRLEELGKPLVLLALVNPFAFRHFPAARAAVAQYGVTPAAGEAAVKVLFGELPPRGRLPVTIPGFARRGDGLQALPGAEKGVRRAGRRGSQKQPAAGAP